MSHTLSDKCNVAE